MSEIAKAEQSGSESERECNCLIPYLEGAGQHSPGCSIFTPEEREAEPRGGASAGGAIPLMSQSDILFLVWRADDPRRVIAFAPEREGAKRKARHILRGDPDRYTVEPLTAPGTGVYLAGDLAEVHA